MRRFSTRPNQGVKDLIQSYESLTNPSRLGLLLRSAVGALRDPTRADLVSTVGDLTSFHSLKQIQLKMMADPNGRRILQDKPRVTDTTWN